MVLARLIWVGAVVVCLLPRTDSVRYAAVKQVFGRKEGTKEVLVEETPSSLAAVPLSPYIYDNVPERYNVGILKKNSRWFDWRETENDPLYTAAFGVANSTSRCPSRMFYKSDAAHGVSDLNLDPILHWRFLHTRNRQFI
jgi:hypothetical protein